MPKFREKETIDFFRDFTSDFVLISTTITEKEEKQALLECDDYFKNKNKNIWDMTPLSIYYIILKLNEDEQIKFIYENIEYIYKYHENIFFYHSLSFIPLSYSLSIPVLKVIYELKPAIINNILNGNELSFGGKFLVDDYIEFYTYFYEEMKNIENQKFICHFKEQNFSNINEKNVEIMDFILKKYQDKIDTFQPTELLKFANSIEKIEIYKSILTNNYSKIEQAIQNMVERNLSSYIQEMKIEKQVIFVSMFFPYIKPFIYKINLNVIYSVFLENEEIRTSIVLKDWIKIFCKKDVFNEQMKKIIDLYEIPSLNELFDRNFFIQNPNYHNFKVLEYIEKKYRNTLPINESLEINYSTSIFSKEYLKNLNYLNNQFYNNKITRNDSHYMQHLMNFIIYLKENGIIHNIRENEFKEIEIFFYRMVRGCCFKDLMCIFTIEDITLINRIGRIEFDTSDFTVEQLKKYNVKQHKKLNKLMEIQDFNTKRLTLKLMLILGYHFSCELLKHDNTVQTLKHLVESIDIKNINIHDNGEVILNQKIMNLLFCGTNKFMLYDKDSDLYQYFPRIFNEWNSIHMYKKDNSLKSVLHYLKGSDVLLTPDYYALEGVFPILGSDVDIVYRTLNLYDEMTKRTVSSIPKIEGKVRNYTYEVLRLDDILNLTVGEQTKCCFSIKKMGYPCLKHAVTSNDGRILVVRENGELIAHSWLWRNGNLLCIDNIEVAPFVFNISFLDVYEKFAKHIIEHSFQTEHSQNCIKNVTLGYTAFGKRIKGIEKYSCIIKEEYIKESKGLMEILGNVFNIMKSLPQPDNYIDYSDSKNIQYLLMGNGSFKFYKNQYCYQDERDKVIDFYFENYYTSIEIQKIENMINALYYRNLKEQKEEKLFTPITLKNVKELHCNHDWYMIIYQNGNIDTYIHSKDKRAYQEIENIIDSKVKIKTLKENI